MPSLLEYAKRNNGAIAECLAFSFAAYITFYHNGQTMRDGCLIGKRGDEEYEIHDDSEVLEFFYSHKEDSIQNLVRAVISNKAFWGDSLSNLTGFEDAVIKYMKMIQDKGMYEAMKLVQ